MFSPTSKDMQNAVTGANTKVDPSEAIPTEKVNEIPSIPLSGIIDFTSKDRSVLGLFAAIPIILQGIINLMM